MKQSRAKKLFLLTNLWFFLLLIVSISFTNLFNSAPDNKVQAATSSTINFQARLLTSSGALVADGFYNVEFKLYSASAGGSAQWTETYYDSNGVTAGNDNRVRVVNGYLSVYLGSLTAFPSTINWDQEQWLTLNVGGTAQTATPTYDGEMTPRLKLSAVPYALTAGSIQRTNGANEMKITAANPTADVNYVFQDAAGGTYDVCTTATICTGYAASSGSGNYIQNGTSPQTADFNITGTGTVGGNFTVTGQQVSIQPASGLASGQSNISQTLTNASSSGGTVNGYNQSITISNTGSGSTTNGFNISLADSSSGGLSNVNRGINISLSGTNSSRAEVGLLSTVTRGVALQGISSGFFGNGGATCNGVNVGLGLCAGDTATSNGGAGIYGYTSSRGTTSIAAVEGSGVYGTSSSGGGGVAGAYYAGLKGVTGNTANAAYTSMGVFGQARGGNGASIYGGYFTLNSSSSASAVGSALFASNSTTTANILQLQDNTTDVFTVADGGNITASGTFNGQTISTSANFTGTMTVAGLLTANGNLTLQAGDTFTMNSDAFTDLTGAGLTVSSGALTVDNSVLDDNFFIQGGNSFGGAAILGTNNNNDLQFETNNVTRWLINTSGHLLPNLDDTYDIGSDTARVRDLFAGPGTVHIGTSTSDEGTISYNTSTNNLTFAATNGVLFQNANNSTTAFQIQNAIGGNIVNVDTVNATLSVLNPILTYAGGSDASGSTNSGTDSSGFNSSVVVGRYQYVAKGQSATACSQAAGSAIGCELQIYDVSDPSVPTYVGGADASGSTNSGTGATTFWDIDVAGRYAYVTASGDATTCSQTAGSAIGCELKVFDISNPTAPVYVGGADVGGLTNSGTSSVDMRSIDVSGRYAYVGTFGNAGGCSQTAGTASRCELQVYDISTPATPTYLGGANNSGTTNGGSSSGAFNNLVASGKYVYVTVVGDGTACSQTPGSAIGCELKVFDVSTPATPTYVGGADASGSTNSGTGNLNFADLSISGRYAYVVSSANTTACSQTPGSAIGCELKVFDVSTPATPTYVGGADASGSTNSGTGSGSFSGIATTSHYAYVVSGASATACSQSIGSAVGCEVKGFDVSTPATPTYVGGADASGSTNSGTGSVGLNGITIGGRYIYALSSGNATACSQTPGSAIGCEQKVFSASGIDTMGIVAGVTDTGTLQVNNNGQVSGDFSIQGHLIVGQSASIGGDLTVTGKGVFRNSTNSTNAFQIQNSTGDNLLTADTSNSRINIIGDTNIGNRYGNRLFSDNFESGNLLIWDTESGDISTDMTTTHGGKYSAKVNPAGTDAYAETEIAPSNTVYARAWVNVTSQTSSNADLLSLGNADESGWWTVYRNGTTVQLWNDCASAFVGSAGGFSASAWHLIEMRITIGASTGTSQVWLDGTQVINATSQNNCTQSIDKVSIGDVGSNTFTAYIDDLSVDTVSNGIASSLNVDDSFHVGGTATFGNKVLIQNTLTVDSLMPATAGSLGNGTITTVDSTGDVGQYSAVAMGSDGFARIAYYDVTNADLKFVQCTNTPCTTKNTTTVDSTGTVGQYASIAMGADGFARIAYYDGSNLDLKFIQCTNASCSTRNTNTVDSTGTVGQYTDLAMGADGFARISYYDASNGDLKFTQCTNASCSTRNTNTIDTSGIQTGLYTSIAMGSDGFARIAYYDGLGFNDLKFIQCTNAACTTRNTNTVDSTGNVGQYNDLTMGSDGFARISYYDVTNTDLKFVRCTNAACSSSSITTVESADSVGQYTSLAMGSDGLARISYYDVTDTDLKLMTCLNINCSSNKINVLDFTGNVGQYTALAIGSDGFARISYYDVTNGDLKLAVEGNQPGSSIGSAAAPFGAIYGTTLNVQGAAIFQQSVEVTNNLSVNGNIYVKGNTDSLTYSANGVAGLTLNCTGGSSVQDITVTGGIITAGSCINASYARVYNTTDTSLTTAIWTTLAFNSETQDTDNYHSTSSNNSRLTVPSDGWYHVTAQVVFPSNATGARGVRIIKNGSTSNIIGEAILPANNGSTTQIPINAQVFLSAGEYIEMQPIQTSGGNLNVTALTAANLNPDTYFAISKTQSGGAGMNNTLQQGYDMGNSITTTDSRNILFNLADTTTDSNFIVNALSGSTGKFAVQNAAADVFSVIPDSKTVLIANNLAVYGGGTGVNGGAGLGANGDTDGGGGGGIGNGLPTNDPGGCAGDTGGQANDISGLFAVVSGLGYATTGPGAGFGSCPNVNGAGLNHGNSATGFGSGGGGPNYYGGNGGAGYLGGGGGAGAAGENSGGNTTGGTGGQGVVVFSPEGSTNVIQTSGTSWNVPGGVTRVKVWAIGGGGGGAGATSVNSSSGGGGGAGGVTYKVFDVTPGQTITYSLGSGGTGATGAVNGNGGGTTTVTVGTITLSATGGAGGVYNNASSNAGGSFSGGDTVSITGNLSATGSLSLFKNSSNSTSSFQIQNATGSTIFNVDTQNGRVGIGTATPLASFEIRRPNQTTENSIRLSTTSDNDWKIYQPTSTSNLAFWGDGLGQDVFTLSSTTGGATFTNAASGGDSNAFRIQSYGGTNFYRADTLVGSNNFGANSNIFTPASDGNVLQVISNTSSLATFNVNTSSRIVQIGSTANDTNGFLLQLDNYGNGALEPSGTNGAMYYNTVTNTFRCYENGGWKDCLSHHVIELGSDVSSSASTAFQNITGLSFSVNSGVNYRFHAYLNYTTSATTIGLRAAVTGPASPTQLSYQTATGLSTTGSGTNGWFNSQSAYDAGTASTSSISTTAGNGLTMDGFIRPSANGTLQLRFAPETATAGGIVIKAGSTLEWW